MQDKGVFTKCSNCLSYRDLRVDMGSVLWTDVSTRF